MNRELEGFVEEHGGYVERKGDRVWAFFPIKEIPGLNKVAVELARLAIHEARYKGRRYPSLVGRRIVLGASRGDLPITTGGLFYLSPVLKTGFANYEDGYIGTPVPRRLRSLGSFLHECGHFYHRHSPLDPSRPLKDIRSENEAWDFAFAKFRVLEALGVEVDWRKVKQRRDLSLGSYDMGYRFDPDGLRWCLFNIIMSREIITPRDLFFSEPYRNAAEQLLRGSDFKTRVLEALGAFEEQRPTPSELLLKAVPPDMSGKWRVLDSLRQFDEQVDSYVSKALSE